MRALREVQTDEPEISVTVRRASKVYGMGTSRALVAVQDVSLKVRKGEFISILGPSGCGKSTLLMLIAGLYVPTSGEIEVEGRPVTRPQTDIGIVFQTPVLLDWRTVLGNILLQTEARRMNAASARKRAQELIASVGLSGFEDCYPFALSGGMRQRVSICRALIHDPSLLLMDEPFGALDALTREQLMIDLQYMLRATRQTVIFVTHSIREAIFQSDRVIVMSPRPSVVERIWTIDLPRPRRLKMTTEPLFTHYVDEITQLFMSKGIIREDQNDENDRNDRVGRGVGA